MSASPASSAPDPQQRAVSNWNIANALTMLRIAMVPVFGWLLLHDGGTDPAWRWWALGVFAVAMATDRLDGALARSRGLITDFGKIADPIADKALVGMAFVGLSIVGDLWWWVTILVLVREIGITVMRFAIIRYGVMPAGRGGKLKTALQAAALLLYIAPLAGFGTAVAALCVVVMTAAVVVTVVTGLDYVRQAWQLVGRARSADTRS